MGSASRASPKKVAVVESPGRGIRRQYIPDADIATKGPMVMTGQTASSNKAPVKVAAAPAKETPAKAAPQAGSQPKAPAKAQTKAATSAAKSPIGKTVKAAMVTLKAQQEAKSEEKRKLPPIIVDGQGFLSPTANQSILCPCLEQRLTKANCP